MRHRCRNPKHPFYKRYGAVGITVCGEWYDDFAQFLKDMGPRPSLDHSIDRIVGTKGYSPDNCRWATSKEQAANRRPAKRGPNRPKITFNGETRSLCKWAEHLGITPTALCHRIYDYHWPLEKALTSGATKRGPKCGRNQHMITYQGQTKGIDEWAAEAGIGLGTFRYRYFIAKWSMKDCMEKPLQR